MSESCCNCAEVMPACCISHPDKIEASIMTLNGVRLDWDECRGEFVGMVPPVFPLTAEERLASAYVTESGTEIRIPE